MRWLICHEKSYLNEEIDAYRCSEKALWETELAQEAKSAAKQGKRVDENYRYRNE